MLGLGVISLAVTAIGGSSGEAFNPNEQTTSLILDFTRDLYGIQSADEAIANAMSPLPSLSLDFSSDQYFVGGF